MTCCNANMNNSSVSESARSAFVSFNAVRFYSYCVFYYFGWSNSAGAEDLTMYA